MKGIISIFLLLVFPLMMVAQSKKVKLYAFQQEVLPGVRKTSIDESGQTKEIPNKIRPRIFIYLEAPRDKKIDPKHIWINGKLFGVNVSTPQLPVVLFNTTIPGKAPDTLARQTNNRVIQVEPVTDVAAFTPSSAAKKKMKSNKIVLHTIENGKNCYYYLDSIKILDPVALQ